MPDKKQGDPLYEITLAYPRLKNSFDLVLLSIYLFISFRITSVSEKICNDCIGSRIIPENFNREVF